MPAADPNQTDERWKRKYYDSLEELERKEEHWGTIESQLYQSLSRLSLAAYGSDDTLDKHLDRLRKSLRLREDAKQIEALTERVHGAAAQFHTSRDRKLAAAAPGAVLAGVLDGVTLPGKLDGRRRRLREKLAAANEDTDASRLSRDVAALIGAALELGPERDADAGSPGLLGRLFRGAEEAEPAQVPVGSLDRLLEGLGPVDDLVPSLEALAKRSRGCGSPAEVEALADDLALALCQALQGGSGDDAAPSENEGRGSIRIEPALAALIERLDLPAECQDELEQIKVQLDEGLDGDDLMVVVGKVADLVVAQRVQFITERDQIQRFLEELTERLVSMDGFLDQSDRARIATLDASRNLRDSVSEEVEGLQSGVRTATELDQLRHIVESRLEIIQQHMGEFLDGTMSRDEHAAQEIGRLARELDETRGEANELRARLEEARERAMRDGLTGVHNRAALDDRLESEMARWKRYGQPLSLHMWDVDRFKRLNDQYGHQAGDKVLKAVARLLANATRDSDFVARYGGEEFVLLLPNTDEQNAAGLAEKLRAAIEGVSFSYRGQRVAVTASCGVSAFHAGDSTAADALRRADMALYEAKDTGRNRVVQGTPPPPAPKTPPTPAPKAKTPA